MRIEITGKHMEITPSIREHCEAKCAKLTRYYDKVQEIFVVLEAAPRPPQFSVEIRVDAEHHTDFVARESANDLYECIDLCLDKAVRQLHDFKERLKNNKH